MGWEWDEDEECINCGCTYYEHHNKEDWCPDEDEPDGWSRYIYFEPERDRE